MKINYVLFLILFSAYSFAAENPTIKMATDQWPPYYGENMQNQGPISEISRQVLNKLGYQLNISFTPWKRALEHTRKGKYHAVLGAYTNKERSLYFWNSDPILSSFVVLFGHIDNKKSVPDLDALNNQRVCIINGYYYSDEFTNNNFISKVKSNSLRHCFERLIAQRVDYVVADKLVGQALINEQFPAYKNQITTLPLVIAQGTIHILWSKQIPENLKLNVLFNNELQRLKESGEIDLIWQKYGF